MRRTKSGPARAGGGVIAPRAGSRRAGPAAAGGKARREYTVFVRDLVIPCSIGIHPHERELGQRVRVNVALAVKEGEKGRPPTALAGVVSYEDVILAVKRIAAGGHIGLVETFAERIAEFCLADPRVRLARVRVEKLDVFAEAASVGVEVERGRGPGAAAGGGRRA